MFFFRERKLQHFLLLMLVVASTTTSKCRKKIPVNDHGIQPTTIISEAKELHANNLLLFIPILSTEWSVQLQFKLLSEHADGRWCNIMHVTKGQNRDVYGDRVPAIFFDKFNMILSIQSAVNGIISYNIFHTIQYNTEYNVEIHQRYKSGGVYKYSILFNGEEIHSTNNTQARQFYGVKVYISDPWYNACIGLVKNVKITNFL
ncbi:uncharacterized protein [Clytia hemisphaerica]